jgi:hypothetical protein
LIVVDDSAHKFPNQVDLPDFSDGEVFLGNLRTAIRSRHRRRVLALSALATASAALLFVFSFTVLERQSREDLWETYLMTQADEVVDMDEMYDMERTLYLESLLNENDLSILMENVLSLNEGENWIITTKLEG